MIHQLRGKTNPCVYWWHDNKRWQKESSILPPV